MINMVIKMVVSRPYKILGAQKEYSESTISRTLSKFLVNNSYLD